MIGGLAALVSTVFTAIYLALIEVDDGLEALLYLPLLGAMLTIVAGLAGWRGRSARWPLNATLGATASTAIVLLLIAAVSRDITFVDAAAGTFVVVAGVALTGAFVGWAVGDLLGRYRRRVE